MVFPCIKCGLCCRELSKVPALVDYDRGDGVCRHLNNNLCDIYKQRPVICNVGMMYDLYFRAEMDELAFIRKNLAACLRLARDNLQIRSKLEMIFRQEV